jgi:hypothetical protein
MCDTMQEKSYADAGTQGEIRAAQREQAKIATSNFRERLEARRNRLTRQLVEVEEALRLIYSNPDAERIYETFNRAAV